MTHDDKLELEGEVVELRPGAKFKIKVLDKDYENLMVEGYLSGRMRKNYIKLITGDYVRIGVSLYDLSKCIITHRFRPGEYQKLQEEEKAATIKE